MLCGYCKKKMFPRDKTQQIKEKRQRRREK
jgi:hypothetical protein